MPTSTTAPLTKARSHLQDLQAELGALDDGILAAQDKGDATRWMQALARQRELPELIRQAHLHALPMELEAAWETAENCNEAEVALLSDLDAARVDLKAARGHAKTIAFSAPSVERAQHGVVVQVACDAEQAAERVHQQALDATCMALARVEEIENEISTLTGKRPADAAGFRARPLPATGHLILTARTLGPLADVFDEKSAMPPETMWTSGDRRWQLPVGSVPPRAVAHRLGHSHARPDRDGASDHELAIQRQFAEHQQRMAEIPPPSGTATRVGPRQRKRLDLAAVLDRAAEEMSA